MPLLRLGARADPASRSGAASRVSRLPPARRRHSIPPRGIGSRDARADRRRGVAHRLLRMDCDPARTAALAVACAFAVAASTALAGAGGVPADRGQSLSHSGFSSSLAGCAADVRAWLRNPSTTLKTLTRKPSLPRRAIRRGRSFPRCSLPGRCPSGGED